MSWSPKHNGAAECFESWEDLEFKEIEFKWVEECISSKNLINDYKKLESKLHVASLAEQIEMAEAIKVAGHAHDIVKAVGGSAIPGVAQAFAIEKGLRGILNVVGVETGLEEEDKTLKLLNEVKKSINNLTTKLEDASRDISMAVQAGSAYAKIQTYITLFLQSPKDGSVLDSVISPSDGIRHHLVHLQKIMIKKSDLVENNESLIQYICKTCQVKAFSDEKDNKNGNDDFTWGLESACERFGAMLAFQRTAIEILRKAMLAKGHAKDVVTKIANDHHAEIDEQVDMFMPTFIEYWNETAGKSKKLQMKYTAPYYNTIAFNGKFYKVQDDISTNGDPTYDNDEASRRTDNHKLVEVNCTTGKTTTILSLKGAFGPLVVHKRGLWHYSPYNSLMQLDPEAKVVLKTFPTPFCDKKQYDDMFGLLNLISHGGFLYLIEYGCLYQVNTSTNSWKKLSDSWYHTRLAGVAGDHYIYARVLGTISDSVYKINPFKQGSSGYEHLESFGREPVIVGHGHHIYTASKGGHLWAIDTRNGSSARLTDECILDGTATRLYSYGLSIICSKENAYVGPYLPEVVKVKPYWFDIPSIK